MLVSQLLSQYYAHQSFLKLTLSTQKTYRSRLAGVADLLEGKEVKEWQAEDADELYALILEEHGKHRAVSVCVILRKVWNFAIRYRQAITNPFAKMGLDTLESRDQVWSKEAMDLFYNGCIADGVPSLVTLSQLCYYLAQRPGDMRRLKWADYDGRCIRYTQQKTGTRMASHVDAELQDILDKLPRNHEYIVVSERTGNPYTAFDYSKLAKKIMEQVGIEGLQLRDLRRTGVSEGAEAGLSDSELLALNGNKTRSTLNVYQVKTEKLNQSATAKRFGR